MIDSTIYKQISSTNQASLLGLQRKSFLLSMLRISLFVLAAYSIYALAKGQGQLWIALLSMSLVIFLVVIRVHNNMTEKIKFIKALIEINVDEVDFLERKRRPTENGTSFKDALHPYAEDLDIFGDNSLFQFINRTETFPGKLHVANSMKGHLSFEEIQLTQQAVKECTPKINWRQSLMAQGRVQQDQELSYNQLIDWSKSDIQPVPLWMRVLSFILPAALIILVVMYNFTDLEMYWKLASFIFTLNLIIFSQWLKKIKQEMPKAEKIHAQLLQYGKLMALIEHETWTSEKMKSCQASLQTQQKSASQLILKLSSLFERMDSLNNLVGAVLFNGVGLYHIHVFHTLNQWRQQNSQFLTVWLNTIGEVECINSLSNLSYNHPHYCFPTLNQQANIEYKGLGHPLIPDDKRVNNDISFTQQPFVILTGSNMSGKSTFLRSLGVNAVLAGMGGAVCAQQANIHPLNLIVSMRLSDSLGENESFFFAEVKKLKYIMDTLRQGPCFILLDEILRGTNSEDKRNGTILFLEKLIKLNAIGVIATHDIEVCKTTDLHPNYLSNQCFEVDLSHQELHFDYTLRQGICQNKSATFLMKKMEII